jgi:hypothetical protein
MVLMACDYGRQGDGTWKLLDRFLELLQRTSEVSFRVVGGKGRHLANC